MGKIISVVNQKGGVGKTTTSVNLAAGIGKLGKRVLLVDADPQGNTTSAYGINKQKLVLSVYDLLIGKAKAADAIVETQFDGVDLIPCNMDLAGAEVELISLQNREAQLKTALVMVKEKYDYIFIDCPPSLGLITINSLCASDTVLVPIQCEYFALEGLSQLISSIRQVKRLYNPRIELEGVLLTMFDGRLNLTQQVVSEVKRFFAKELYSTTIPRAVRLSEAPSYGKPIQYYDPKNKGARAYDALSEEFIKRNGGFR
ncbi:MAG: ParA family protein [Clostridia bacterium]|nr:ParA family protein [Clostridia bacterium]